MEALDVEIAADYLVIAATLVFLKSKSLLPAIPAEFLSEGDESPEEVEEKLRERLVAYSKYKTVARELGSRRQEAESFYYREAGDPSTDLLQRYRIAPGKLAGALLAALRSAKPEKRSIARERFSVAAQMNYIARIVRERGPVDFAELCRDFDLAGIIATFLAILEMLRQCRLSCEQTTPAGPLRLSPFTPVCVS